jgi:DNA-binding NarL/FixJ family response regulator
MEEGKTVSAKSLQQLGLTTREADILYWVENGKTNDEVATIFDIAVATIKKHSEKTYHTLGVDNRTTAAMLAVDDLGIAEVDLL